MPAHSRLRALKARMEIVPVEGPRDYRLDKLRAANDRMRQQRADIESAAEGRRIARLALEAKIRGKQSTQDVIGRNGHMRWPEVLAFVEAVHARLAAKAIPAT